MRRGAMIRAAMFMVATLSCCTLEPPNSFDGIVQASRGEACDDGNLRTGDGCDAANAVEQGWLCDNAHPSLCEPVCGDAYLLPAYETCDDGDRIDTNACRNDCTEAVCGDGVTRTDLQPGDAGHEVCDDGNSVDEDDCRNDCRPAVCGDGLLSDQAGANLVEACDDGFRDPCGTCDESCSGPGHRVVCGDGLWCPEFELCDEGSEKNGSTYATCPSDCGLSPGAGPPRNPFDRSGEFGSRVVQTPGYARDVAVSNGYAYVASYDAGLQVVDIYDPNNPVLAGEHVKAGYALGVAATRDHVFVAQGHEGLHIFSLERPYGPILVGALDTDGEAWAVAVADGRAYVADWSDGLLILDVASYVTLDVADFVPPLLLGRVDTPGEARAVAVHDGYAYVADNSAGLQIIDVHDPANPSRVGSSESSENAFDVAVAGGTAYVADPIQGLMVYDVSEPSSPRHLHTVDFALEARGVSITDERAFVSGWGAGVLVLDISEPQRPRVISQYVPQGWVWRAISIDGIVYAASASGGLAVIEPQTPRLVEVDSDPGEAGSESIYEMTWTDRDRAHDEQVLCFVADGTCRISAVDHQAARATLHVSGVATDETNAILVMVGNESYFESVLEDRVGTSTEAGRNGLSMPLRSESPESLAQARDRVSRCLRIQAANVTQIRGLGSCSGRTLAPLALRLCPADGWRPTLRRTTLLLATRRTDLLGRGAPRLGCHFVEPRQ